MKLLVKLIVLAAIAAVAYLFLVPGASVDDFSKGLTTLTSKVEALTGKSQAQAASIPETETQPPAPTRPANVSSLPPNTTTASATSTTAVSSRAASTSAAPPATTSAQSAAPTPKPLEVIRLKNGKSIVGNIVVRDSEITMIRTVDGKSTQVATKDIVVGNP